MVSEKRSMNSPQTASRNSKTKSNKKPLESCLICGSIRGRIAFIPTKSTLVGLTSTLLCDFINEIVGDNARFSEFVCQTCYVTLEQLDIQRTNVEKLQTCIISKYQKTKADLLSGQNILPDLIYNSLLNVGRVKTGTTLNICDQLSVTVYHKNENSDQCPSEEDTNFQMPCDITIAKGTNKRKCSADKSGSSKKRVCMNVVQNGTSKGVKRKLLPVENFAGPKLEMGLTSSVLSEGLEALASSSQEFPSYPSPSKDTSMLENTRRGVAVSVENNNCLDESTSKTSGACSDSNSIDSASSAEFSHSQAEPNEPSNQTSIPPLHHENAKNENTNETDTSSSSETVSLNPEIAQAVLMHSSMEAADLLNSFVSSSLWLGPTNTPGDNKTINESKQDKLKRLELKNTGQSYVNTKGKVINAKKVTYQDCSRCPLRCNDSLPEAAREEVFAEYWGIGNCERQKEYLASHMTRVEKTAMTGFSRTIIHYFLSYNGEKVPVCRQFFLKTLDVSEKLSRSVLKRKQKLHENTNQLVIKTEVAAE